jgi:hypothetical protein
MTIERTRTAFGEIANPFQDRPPPSPDFDDGLHDLGLAVQTGTPPRSVGGKRSWVMLDEYWGKRLNAERVGRMYRLPRREFVRRMAALDGSSISAKLHDSSVSKAYGQEVANVECKRS